MIINIAVVQLQLMTAAWLNGIGAAGRILSTIPTLNGHRYTVLIIGQTLSGCAQPFVLCTPTKLASQWFNERQRTFANMLGSTGWWRWFYLI
jgi:hypothetical protein